MEVNSLFIRRPFFIFIEYFLYFGGEAIKYKNNIQVKRSEKTVDSILQN